MYILKIYIICLVALLSCNSNKKVVEAPSGNKPGIVSFVDSLAASQAIIADDVDGFYDQLSAVEINILMKNPQGPENRDAAIELFKPFIKTQVSDWKTEEKKMMFSIFKAVKKLCDTISPRLYPGNLKLIKIKNGHYGNDVYYTRGNNILIPENIFEYPNADVQIPVMIHELFHVISRSNPVLKNDLYKLIGFSKAEKPVKLNPVLEKSLLTNPDGVSYQYVIELEYQGDTKKAIPLINSKFGTFRPEAPMFFDYLHFDLYSLSDRGDHYMATSTTDGKTLIPMEQTPSFFTKIKDNTQYIIHPDEIMADNFMLALQAYTTGDYSKFSKEGKALIDQVIERLSTL